LKFTLPKIYAITDRELSGVSHAEQVRQFAAGGAKLVQIRDKKASTRELYDDSLKAVKIARENNITILINDRVDIALMTNADGVHLGQNDLPPTAARQILGSKAIIGVSTHSIKQARQVVAEKIADYVAFGPIFKTTTKFDHEPLVGLDNLKSIRSAIGDIPLVAIGGINTDNLRAVLLAGADSAAMISQFYQKQSRISDAFRRLSAIAVDKNIVINS
jgi:thiamine-phosphate pyrophosphorylase